MKILIYTSSLFLLLISGISKAQNVEIAEKTVEYLASDKLKGRYPGTQGDSLAINYIKENLEEYGLKPFDFGYVQNFTLTTDIKVNTETSVKLNENELEFGKDYMPLSFSANKSFKGGVGYYCKGEHTRNIKNEDHWAMVFVKNESGEAPSYRNLINTVIDLKENSAKGVIFVMEKPFNDTSDFLPFDYTRSTVSLDIPVMQFSADLLTEYHNFEKLKFKPKYINKLNDKEEIKISAVIKTDEIESETANIAAWQKGINNDDWIVLGAHYDHLGMGGHGSGSRVPGLKEIHNGADDNATGVAMVLMLAEKFSRVETDINIAYVLFGAEEEGLIGSNYFVNNLPMKKNKIKLMVNFDMVGRMEDSALTISGVSTAEEFEKILDYYQNKQLKLTYGKSGFAGSDQVPFYSEKIPVLFFNSGLHDDYHTPEDDVDKINFQGMQLISDLSYRLIDSLINPKTRLTYKKAKNERKSRHGGDMKVTLGIMPDVAGKVEKGLGIDGVSPGGAAEDAGIKKGDIILSLDGKEIGNIYDYMKIMSNFEEGMQIEAIILRNNDEKNVTINF